MSLYAKRSVSSAIATSSTKYVTVRGKDLCSELMGELDFSSYFYFLITGDLPTQQQRIILDACLLAIAEHGITPAVVSARMTLAAAPEALQGAVAAGLLGCGSVILGSAERCGHFLDGLIKEASAVEDPDAVVTSHLIEMKIRRESIPGFGHPIHVDGDPRASRLIEIATEQGTSGIHVAMLQRVERLIPAAFGKALPVNVSGAIPAVMLDCGFPLSVMKGVPLLARTAGLLAHLYEEQARPIGFPLAHASAEAVAYDGGDSLISQEAP